MINDFRFWFQLGSIANLTLLTLASILAKLRDDHSIIYDPISATGIRTEIMHPTMNYLLKRSSFPYFFSSAFLSAGFSYILGSLLSSDFVLNILGSFFGISLLGIAAFDNGKYFNIHQNFGKVNQLSYLILVNYIIIFHFNLINFLLGYISISLLIIFVYLRKRQERLGIEKQNIISQKIFIICQLLFLYLLPEWI
ncbi:MAG: hypothetical protein INQ03_23425 [Candidatus Heimdallarchaeota archaeon]|nr:hypothetical protein [Candidatus Heimdallarchaeota archaeon]